MEDGTQQAQSMILPLFMGAIGVHQIAEVAQV
jgi:hypothetical protein